MNDSERLVELKSELAYEEATVQFFESGAFLPFEKKVKADVETFQEILYNKGRASYAQRDINKENAARVELRIRRELLEHFYGALARRNDLLVEIRELEKPK